jgi:Caspase domain
MLTRGRIVGSQPAWCTWILMKKALLIGINTYDEFSDLDGCVADAKRMYDILRRHEEPNDSNYECRLFTSSPQTHLDREFLSQKWNDLFEDFRGDILFYYSGHGAQTKTGNQFAAQDGSSTIPGLAMDELLALANNSLANEVTLILDCCYAGGFGDPAILGGKGLIREGITILAGSRPKGVAKEIEGHGVFTDLVVNALTGGAADVRGYVSAASIYAYVDQALGAWDQRPIYKSYASRMTPLRRCKPQVPDGVLRQLPVLFDSPSATPRLNPSYEHTHESRKKENVETFNKFKLLRDARLLRTVGGEDLFYAALKSNPVKLTPLGQFYWRLAKHDRF